MAIERDDPRLTAYALGELEGPEAEEVARAVSDRPELAAVVEEVRRAAELVGQVLAAESGPALTDEQREALATGRRHGTADGPAAAGDPAMAALPRPRHWRWGRSRAATAGEADRKIAVDAPPTPWWLVGSVAGLAAVLAVAFVLNLDVGPVVTWLNVVRSSGGHESASRTMADEYHLSVLDAILGRAGESPNRSAYATNPDPDAPSADRPAAEGSMDVWNLPGQMSGAPAVATAAPPAPLTGGPYPAPEGADGDFSAPTAGGGRAPVAMVVKNADLALEVESVRTALAAVEGIAARVGGYVQDASSQLPDRDQGGSQRATVVLRVPASRFEETVSAIRDIGRRVLRDNVAGSEVGGEYVDLQSQIGNLEATAARVRSFLNDADTVEDALRVNAQLTDLEGQIAILRGRAESLADAASYSTIAVELVEAGPTPSPSPTSTPTATPTPTPRWSAADTANDATGVLRVLLEVVASAAIWLAIVALPLAAPVVAAAWLVRHARAPRP